MKKEPPSKSATDEDRSLSSLIKACLLVALGFTVLALSFYIVNFYDSWVLGDKKDFAQFGDYIGGTLNPVIAFCALMALLFGIRQQRKELKETREQFAHQSIDGVFFQMLKLHNDMLSSMESDIELKVGHDFYKWETNRSSPEVKENEKLGRGREIFRVIYGALKYNHSEIQKGESTQEYLDRIYEPTFQQCQSHLGHYFRYLYNIFQFIDKADIKNKRKLFYGKLVRAQLSNHELAVLYYNCLSHLGNQKFKPLAEEYRLFKNLPVGLLLSSDHFPLYEPEAWGSNYENAKTANESRMSLKASGFIEASR